MSAPHVAMRATDLSIARQSRRYEPVTRVVDGVDFTLARGETLILMGPTGSGKSSLATVLAGIEVPGLDVVGGDARVEGISVRRPGRRRRALHVHVGHVPQGAGPQLPARMTVGEIIAEPITSRDRKANRRAVALRVATLIDEMRLPLGVTNSYPYELSAGMRQRVAIARALVLEPRTLVGDDLFANLDVDARRVVRDALARRRDERELASFIVTNDAEAVRSLEADVLVLRGGHPVAYGRGADGLVWTPGSESDRRLVSS